MFESYCNVVLEVLRRKVRTRKGKFTHHRLETDSRSIRVYIGCIKGTILNYLNSIFVSHLHKIFAKFKSSVSRVNDDVGSFTM